MSNFELTMILRAPGFKDHLSYETTFSFSQEWSLNSDLTVLKVG